MNTPLAERMRPKNLEEYVGQKHLIGPKGGLTPILKSGNLPSMILWGSSGHRKNNPGKVIGSGKRKTLLPTLGYQFRRKRNKGYPPKIRAKWWFVFQQKSPIIYRRNTPIQQISTGFAFGCS